MTDFITIPVRLSHILGYCAVGSVIRGPKFLVTPMDTTFWRDAHNRCAARIIPYVDQVRSALGIDRTLREPPVARLLESGQVDGSCIPAMRFPAWMRCPKCKRLHCAPWRHQDPEALFCENCDDPAALEQVQWVFVHPDGHMADVPWHRLAHREVKHPSQKACRPQWDTPYLILEEASGTTGFTLSCNECKATVFFKEDHRAMYGRLRCQPWLTVCPVFHGTESETEESFEGSNERENEDDNGCSNATENASKEGSDGGSVNSNESADQSDDEKKIDVSAVVLSINDTRVHRPVNTSALVIPPESRIRKGSVVDRIYVSSPKRDQMDRPMPQLVRESLYRQWANEFRSTPDAVKEAVEEIRKGYPTYGMQFTQGRLMESEYRALTAPIPDLSDDEDFVPIHHTDEWLALKKSVPAHSRPARIVDAVKTLVSLHHLKEILILKGFLRPCGQSGNAELVPPDIFGTSDWLPALELYGEGIFFTLEEERLSQWERRPAVIERAAPMAERFRASGLTFEPPIIPHPRFILLHTLAHLVIRELETLAGYPAASLKERIYARTGWDREKISGKEAMAGILIYVAVPDVEGSLGGLFELARPERFLRLLSAVFDQAQWCSLDPVCSEHEGQGPNLLNRAACHACTLIPEPSCCYGNTLLDRGLVKAFIDPKAAL